MLSVSPIRIALLSLMILSALFLYAHDHGSSSDDPAVVFAADSSLLTRTGILSVMPGENMQFQEMNLRPVASSHTVKLQSLPGDLIQ